MGYYAKILAHSVPAEYPRGYEPAGLMTVECRYPRIVLAETVTHRVCRDTFGEFDLTTSDRTTTEDVSKNSASSRAIPIKKMIEQVMVDPYVPDRFSKNGKGMQAAGYWVPGDPEYDKAREVWLEARDKMVNFVGRLEAVGDVGVHKQEANRLLEPWMWVTQILTADTVGWNNFFALRCDKAAHPAFQKIARMIFLEYYRRSTPEVLRPGEWHLPFVPYEQRKDFRWVPNWGERHTTLPEPIRHSAARCAWVSYENHDKDGSPEQMDRTFDRLLAADPKHASPVEHQGTPQTNRVIWDAFPFLRSNFRDWVQARKLVRGERTEVYCPTDAEIASWGLE